MRSAPNAALRPSVRRTGVTDPVQDVFTTAEAALTGDLYLNDGWSMERHVGTWGRGVG